MSAIAILEGIKTLLIVLVILFFYFVPTIIAVSRKHKNDSAIAVLNFLLGWTIIGWIGCLVWCLTDNTREPNK